MSSSSLSTIKDIDEKSSKKRELTQDYHAVNSLISEKDGDDAKVRKMFVICK